eukprot:Sspe_Gene.108211::Locus_87380_Transcript_1_1_Confidence_1.000_Length_551::g.108211::m.108211
MAGGGYMVPLGVDGLAVRRRLNPATLLQQLPRSNTPRVSILVIGAAGCGKTQLVQCWLQGTCGAAPPSPTIGVESGTKEVVAHGTPVKVTVFDTSGDPQFFEVRNEFYKEVVPRNPPDHLKSGAILLCYDVTNPQSFASLTEWMKEVKKFCRGQGPPLFLVGCRTDMPGRK